MPSDALIITPRKATNGLVRVIGSRRVIVVLDVQPAEITHVILRIELSLRDACHRSRNAELNRIAEIDVGVLETSRAPRRVNCKLRVGRVRRIEDIRLNQRVNTTCEGIPGRHIVDHVDKPVIGMRHAQWPQEFVPATRLAEVLTDRIVIARQTAGAHLVGDQSEDRTAVLGRKRVHRSLLKNEGLVEVIQEAVRELRGSLGRSKGGRALFGRIETRFSDNLIGPFGPVITVPLDPVVSDLLIKSADNGLHLLLTSASKEEVIHTEPRRVDALVEELHLTQGLVKGDGIAWWDTRVPGRIIK